MTNTKIDREVFSPGELVLWKWGHSGQIIFPNGAPKESTKTTETFDFFSDLGAHGFYSVEKCTASYSDITQYRSKGFDDIEIEKHGLPKFGMNLSLVIDDFDFLNRSEPLEHKGRRGQLLVLKRHSVSPRVGKTVLRGKDFYLCMYTHNGRNRIYWIDGDHLERVKASNFGESAVDSIKRQCLERLRQKKILRSK